MSPDPRSGAAAAPGSEYARYMRTDELLSLQRSDAQLLHRDERLFQCVHQSTELWLKQAHFEIDHARALIEDGRLAAAQALLARARGCVEQTTGQLRLLESMSSLDFGQLRPALGRGSGLESPGWRALREAAQGLLAAFMARCEAHGLTLDELFRRGVDAPLYPLAEALLDLDQQVTIWRVKHLFVAVRTIGTGGIGTQGMPVQSLARLLEQRLFATLWEARAALAGAYGGAAHA